MRTLLFVISAFLCLPGYGQFYQSCIDVPTYTDDGSNHNNIRNSIVRNATGDMAMVGNLKMYKLTKAGVVSWSKDLTLSVRDFEVDNSGNVLAIHNQDLSIIKYASANGAKAWENTFTSVALIDAVPDNNGNVYATGYDYGNDELYIAKYDPATGADLWQGVSLVSLPNYNGQSIAVSSTGDVYILAYNFGTTQYKLIKYSSAGALQWQIDYNNNLNIGGVKVGPDGNAYITAADFNSSRLIKVRASDGAILENELFDLGKIIVAFRGNDFVVVGQNGSGNYALVNYPSTFPTPTAADYIDTFSAFDIDYPYVSINIEADGTAGLVFSIQDFIETSTLIRYSPTGDKLTPQVVLPTFVTGAVLDSNGDYIIPTRQQCVKRLTSCDKLAITIITPPQSQKVCAGSTVQFTVAATGTGLLYQWKKGADLLANGGHISGATTATLTITGADNVNDGGSYTCTIYDGCNHTKTTTAVTLTFVDGPIITGQPTAVEACAGSNINFTITATGQNVKYQWKKGGVALVDNTLITGAKTANLGLKTIAATDAGLYTCDVTSDCFATPITSQSASLTVFLPASVITPPPATAAACAGNDLSITLVASGANLTYQWRKGANNLVESGTVVGTKTNTLTLKQLAAGDVGQYSCVITGMCGNPATSSATTVSISTPSQITSQPVSKSVCTGTNVSFSITASGPSLTYTWRKGNTVVNNGGKYSGATTATLTITGATELEAGAYTCTINNPCGSEIASSAAQLNIDPAPSIVSQSGNTALCEGDVGRISVTTGTGNFQFQWKKDGVVLTDGMAHTGTTTDELLIISASTADAGVYTCEVKSGCGNPINSTGITVAVSNGTQIVSQTTDLKTCQDDKLTLSVTASGNGLTYSWKKNGSLLSDAGTISGSKTATLTIQHISPLDEGRYTCEVTGTCKGTAISDGIDVDIDPKPNLVLATDIDCKSFQPVWSELVTDTNFTEGEYTLFKKGSTTPLGLMDIDGLGEYLIVKNTGTCADTVIWNNTCVITGTESTFSSHVSVAPNPSNGLFKIQNLARPLPFELYNAQGKLVLSAKEPRADGFVDAQHLSDGLYLLSIQNESGKGETLRVIISKEQ
ncbi:immunoglobulin domain-containing protein [Chryseolinea soli]|uniref:T9SS C-terminal target domain-containing protein n=1 Tax=Chryseolinea soli TaxID=2321403 RepID=A0A385SUJ4_9BACT|nr:immunoglobulin domain-containing protein [Chryseolinea soli]AYB33370.1 T9SS C-terminal target domain-containing protein [Chryseolinea soli]